MDIAAMAVVILIAAYTFKNAYNTAINDKNWFGAALIALLGLGLTALALFQLFFRR